MKIHTQTDTYTDTLSKLVLLIWAKSVNTLDNIYHLPSLLHLVFLQERRMVFTLRALAPSYGFIYSVLVKTRSLSPSPEMTTRIKGIMFYPCRA